MKWDIRDWIILALVTGAWAFASLFLWTHPSDTNFMTWAGFAVTIVGVYHWLVVVDSKRADAC